MVNLTGVVKVPAAFEMVPLHFPAIGSVLFTEIGVAPAKVAKDGVGAGGVAVITDIFGDCPLCKTPFETLVPEGSDSNRNRIVPSVCKVSLSTPPAGQVEVPLTFFSSNTRVFPLIWFSTRSIKHQSVAIFPQMLPTSPPGWMVTFITEQ